MTASAAVASSVGHGVYGLRSNLRQFSDLVTQTGSQKQVFLEMRASVRISPGNTWTLTAGTTYELVLAPGTFDGKTLDWVGMKTLNASGGETLTRRESQAAVTATAGSWYYDRATTKIYVRLSTTTTNPNSFAVVGEVGFYFGSHAVTMPHFGTEKLVDGGFETWSSATNLTNWTEALSGAGNTVDRESTDVQVGTYALKLTSTGAASGSASVYVDTTDSTIGGSYCISGLYKTPTTQSANLSVRVVVSRGGADTNVVQSDGRTYLTGTEPTLTPTNGEWRRFEFHYIHDTTDPFGTERVRLKLSSSVAGAGYVLFDDVQWRPVYAWNFYEPRVENLAQFTVREARADVYWGSWTIGVGAFALLNSGPEPGYFEELTGRFNFLNAPVYVRQGGRFSDDCEEITPTGLYLAWFARVKRPQVTDGRCDFPVRDTRDLFLAEIPKNRYSIEAEPDLDERFEGASRPVVIGGQVNHVSAARVDLTANSYGIYELADPSDMPVGIHNFPVLMAPTAYQVGWAYDTEESAAKEDVLRRYPIYTTDVVGDGTGPHVTLDTTTARMTVIEDLKVSVTTVSEYVDFTRNGTTYVAALPAGVYIPNTMCIALQTAMNTAAGVASITVTYSDSTHKVTIADPTAATLTLLTKTGANVAGSVWPRIGWPTGGSDRTGALTYTSTNAGLFTDPDSEHILRWNIYGAGDDASGTYTGSASNAIKDHSDVMRYLLIRHLGIDPARIDNTSFVAARALVSGAYLYLDKPMTVRAIFERLEMATNTDLQIVGDRFYLRPRSDSVPANVVDVFDNDILQGTFSSWIDDEDIFGTVHVDFGEDPSTKAFHTRSSGLSRVDLTYGRPDQKRFPTFFGNTALGIGSAEDLRDILATMAETPKRKFRMSVKGKLYTKGVSDTFRLNRSRAVTDASGDAPETTPVLLRILDITRRADFTVDVIAVEV